MDFTDHGKYVLYPFVLDHDKGLMDFGTTVYQKERTDICEKQIRNQANFCRWMFQGGEEPDKVTYKVTAIKDVHKNRAGDYFRIVAGVIDSEWRVVIVVRLGKKGEIDKKSYSFGYTTDIAGETLSVSRYPFLLKYSQGKGFFDFGGGTYLPEKTNIYEKVIRLNEYFTRWVYTTDKQTEMTFQIQSIVRILQP